MDPGKIAHRLNNCLTTIQGYSEILLSDLDQRSPHRWQVEEILRAARQAAAVTRDLPKLRALDGSASEAAAEEARGADPQPGTVLVVEDEHQVRELIVEVLSGAGFRALAARSGLEAMKLTQDDGRGPELLITDLDMPEMGGREVAALAAFRWPAVKVLYISGKSAPASGESFLAKPFSPAMLLEKVAEVRGPERRAAGASGGDDEGSPPQFRRFGQ